MKIAILGWGSLIWCPKNLDFIYAGDADNTYRGWYTDGPELPIEFARVSSKGKCDERLTLVVQPGAKPVRTLWALSKATDISSAKANLDEREGCKKRSCVAGWKPGSDADEQVTAIVAEWAKRHHLDAVIWTSLSANYGLGDDEEKLRRYMRERKGESLKACKEYIQNTPQQITTGFRRALEALCDEL